MRIIGKVAWLGGAGAILASLSCGDSTGPVSQCPGAKTVRLHFVNTTDSPGLMVGAAYGEDTCGPVDLPVTDEQGGLELAQLLIEGNVGDVITVSVVNAFAAGTSAQCRITSAAQPQGDANRLQTFVNVIGGTPPQVSCAEGLEPA